MRRLVMFLSLAAPLTAYAEPVRVDGPRPAFPADAPNGAYQQCRVYLDLVEGVPPALLDVVGCDAPFAEATRAAVPGWIFTGMPSAPNSSTVRVSVVFRRVNGRGTVEMHVDPLLAPRKQVPPPYPASMLGLALTSVRCTVVLRVEGATGTVTHVDASSCPLPYQEEVVPPLSRWTFQPMDWKGAPAKANFQLGIDFRMEGGHVDSAALDAPVRWQAPAYPAGHTAQADVRSSTVAAFDLVRRAPIDWRQLHGALPLEGTVCPVDVFVDAQGRPYWFDMAACPPGMREATWKALTRWRWKPKEAEPEGDARFHVELKYAAPTR